MHREQAVAALNRVQNLGRALSRAPTPAAQQAFDAAVQRVRQAVDDIFLQRTAAATAARIQAKKRQFFTLTWRSSGKVETFQSLEEVADRVQRKPQTLASMISRGKGVYQMYLFDGTTDETGDNVALRRLYAEPAKPALKPREE